MLRDEEDIEPNVGPFGWYIDSFRELSTCRSAMAVAPIPFTAIADYCKLYGVEDSDEFLFLIRALDTAYIKIHQKDDKSGTGK